MIKFQEPCLGGELWTHLKKHKKFNEERAMFYTACTIEAIYFLHRRKIVYRDIKPENLLLDRHGYAKLADFGYRVLKYAPLEGAPNGAL